MPFLQEHRKEKPEEYELEIKKIRKKRSLDANSYYWALLGKLASVLRTSQDELHEHLLQDYGVLRSKNGEPVTFTLRADINSHEVTKYTKVLKTGRIYGKGAVMYGVLKGSSEMDTQEFSVLLDGLIYECKEQGIETISPEELAKLKILMEEQNAQGISDKI